MPRWRPARSRSQLRTEDGQEPGEGQAHRDDERTKTTSAGLDVGAGLGTPKAGAGVRPRTRATASLNGAKVRTATRLDGRAKSPAGGAALSVKTHAKVSGGSRLLSADADLGAPVTPAGGTPL
ncbi:hypothetical protein AB0C84_41550 [Actinomadura sp. NPDC048955]|uniref:hypothetical protein n=1 Tax=Actinomadura sp. NPDC048955 TaxID=3158228 RepID=UPI0033F7C1EB